MGNWPHKHILTLSNFSIDDYKSVFELTDRFKSLNNAGTKKIPALQGKLITSIFFEAVLGLAIVLSLLPKGFPLMYRAFLLLQVL